MLFLATSFRISHIRLLGICFLYLSVVAATHAGCPLQISPQSVVVRYGDSASADCKALVTHIGMGWESTAGGVPLTTGRVTTWRVSKLTDWNIEPPFCYINYNNNQCTADLPVTIFKTPDSVSISAVNHTGPMIEGNQYELQCDIHNVAPVQNLTVNWYKGETLVNQTSFNDTIKSPVNKTTTLLIHPNRHDDGAQYRCEAELKLGEEGPQPPPNVTSDPFKITTVYFEPTINATNLPSTVSVVRGSKKVLYCIAEGNPRPTIIWSPSTNTDNNGAYTVTEFTPENLTCTATNSVGQDIKSVRVEIIDISISAVNHIGPMIEGKQYELQCVIHNVTSVRNHTVNWYKEILGNQTSYTDTIKSPVYNTSKILIRPDRHDDGAQYRCEAELKLGEDGPQPPPKVTSDPLSITVHFKPLINETLLHSKVPVFRGYPMELLCEAEGKPEPEITWKVKDKIIHSKNLTVTELTPRILYCIANNSVNSTMKEVIVDLKEDYLPLIAGLVAITVAFISVIFIFIYSIYYKTAKMGRYSLKDAKLSAQNGDIAQNGKDNTIPMKKLSQCNILA